MPTSTRANHSKLKKSDAEKISFDLEFTMSLFSGVRLLALCFVGGLLPAVSCSLSTFADDSPAIAVPALTADEQAAMNQIRQPQVLGTVAFLASDEMAGRNTPSPELTIASSYVAARFRGAGLEGLGPNGSYFQTQQLSQFGPPAAPAQLTLGTAPSAPVTVIFAADRPVQLAGPAADMRPGADQSGAIVVMDEPPLPPQAATNPAAAAAAVARRLQPLLQAKGAPAAVLLRTAVASPLREAFENAAGRPLELPGSLQPATPVVLVPDTLQAGQPLKLSVPARISQSVEVRNVAAVLRGSNAELSKQAVIISAHLDHIGRVAGDRSGDTVNNGADDNATGVTAVVTLADAFTALEQRPERSVVFLTFWGEEKGLLGSKQYCEQPLWPLEQTVANVNIEMIGRPEDGAEQKMWGTGWTRSSLGPQLAAGAARAGITVFHREDVSEMLYARSDNYSFVQKGVIAHSFSAGSLHADYHQPTDEVSRLNLPHMTRIIQGLFAGTLPLTRGQLTPEKSAP